HALADVPGGQAEAELADVVAVHHRAPEVRELELAGVVGTGAAALRDHAALQGAGAVEAEPVLARAEVEPVVHAAIDAARLAAGQVGELRLHVIHLADEVRRAAGGVAVHELAVALVGAAA